MPSIYALLNADAKSWPYHVGDRPKQRRSIRNTLEILRNVQRDRGYCLIGHHGEVSFTYGTGCLSGCSEIYADVAKRAGIIVIDCRTADFAELYRAACGPMPAIGRAPDPPPWHALSYAPLDHWIERYRGAGATIHTPDPATRLRRQAEPLKLIA